MMDRVIEWLFEWVLCLPLSLTQDSERKWVRVCGFLLYFPWFVIVAPIWLLMPFLLVAALIEEI